MPNNSAMTPSAESSAKDDDDSRSRRAEYAWPAEGVDVDARLAVEVRLAQDGTMAAWRYRAHIEGASVEANAAAHEAASNDGAMPAPLLYRHAQAYVFVDDPARAIPGEAHAFARESFIDELACGMRRDPVALRLKHLDASRDAGAREIIRMVSERAAWGAEPAREAQSASPWLRGRGFAFDGRAAGGEAGEASGEPASDTACTEVSLPDAPA